ncbi:hypothetical protein GON26_16010 [Flavobacterium sp. GA093]|uniref:Uncharacterized protein n=1 Tax=Flavobacterium hydrocarbonoxydans TaxID=2683249 RepID=A0A6I4NP58_9FLAO|nr:hypothetical protein [Flavobacterium hydrocarbonoxydans]MWB95871.1 hypothetical protein [Flavobacterium hydrocarbonoxydans]
MKKHYKNKWLKGAFATLLVLGIGASFFLFSKELNEGELQSKTEINIPKEAPDTKESLGKRNILDSLNLLKLAYDVALLEKTSLSEELEFQKRNVENLMEIIKASKEPSLSEIDVYRRQLSELKTTLDAKVLEINQLKSQNKKLLTEIETQNVVMYKQKTQNDTLVSKQKQLESTIKAAARLSLNNFKVVALKESSSGKESETKKAKHTKKLKVSFSVLANAIAKTGKKIFYIQVLDQKNKVLGEDKLIEFDYDKALVYSFIAAVDFQGKAANVYGILNADENPFQKGTYFVNFFDKQEILGSTSITLE